MEERTGAVREPAERAQWESKELLERMFNAINVLIAHLDRNFNFIRVNQAYARADGKEPGFFPGKNHFALYPNAENERLFRQVVETGKPYVAREKAFAYAGHPEWGTTYWDWRLEPVLNADGSVGSVVLSLIEVTKRVRALGRLIEAQRIAHVGSWELDMVSNVLTWSDEIYRIFEIDPEAFGASYEAFLNAVHPEDRDFVNAAYTESVANKKPYDIEHRLLMADGRLKHVRERCETLYGEDGRALRSIGTVQDITDAKRAETELRRLNRALSVLSKGNEALVRESDEMQLLQAICRVVVNVGGYHFAWIGYTENGFVEMKAQAGLDQAGIETLHQLRLRIGDNDCTNHAVQTGDVCLRRFGADDPALATVREEALKMGCESMLAAPLQSGKEFFGALTVCSETADAFSNDEVRLARELASDLAYGIRSIRTEQARRTDAERLQSLLFETIHAMALTIEKRDPYTAGHQARVAELATAIAKEMGIDADRIEGIRLGAMIHDIGKIYVPAEILTRPGKLTDIEFDFIKTHCNVGYEITKEIPFPWPVGKMVLQHHERLDGSGYPQGLKNGEIVLEARILAVADVVEAISAHRPYRPALGMDAAMEEITARRGAGYDPDVVDACVKLIKEKNFTFSSDTNK